MMDDAKQKIRVNRLNSDNINDGGSENDQKVDDSDEENKSMSSDPSAKMVDQMISQAKKKFQHMGSSLPSIGGPSDAAQYDQLVLKLEDSELLRAELENEIDRQKIKARGLLMQKELSERRIKLIIQKFEGHMKNNLNMTQDQINQIGQLNEDELQQLYELERDLENEI